MTDKSWDIVRQVKGQCDRTQKCAVAKVPFSHFYHKVQNDISKTVQVLNVILPRN